jgi:hypothetical protein
MKLHPANPSPEQLAKVERLASNFIGKINLKQRTPAEEEAYEQQVDALPTPPAWYRATVLSDPTSLYEAFSTLTSQQIKENVELLVSRHRKENYQTDLVAAGSVEKLEYLQWRRQGQQQGYKVGRLLSDRNWASISPLLPARPDDDSQPGNMLFVEGIVRTWLGGGLWDAWPEDELGDYKKAYQRTIEWVNLGVWGKMADRLPYMSIARWTLRIIAIEFNDLKQH